MPLTRQTAYDQLAQALRSAILAGDHEPTDDNPDRTLLPGAAELGTAHGVSDKTAARAIQQLITEGLVKSRPGQRAVVVPRQQRPDRWPMDRRYARARAARGLVFGDDLGGREVTKRVTHTGQAPAPPSIAALLNLGIGDPVWARERETLIDERVAKISVSYFVRPAEHSVLTFETRETPGEDAAPAAP
jgi:DNA-binding GntR family transcriptional regulator